MPDMLRVLLFHHDATARAAVAAALERDPGGLQVIVAHGRDHFESLLGAGADVVLCALGAACCSWRELPDMARRAPQIPVVLLAAPEDAAEAIRALKGGAADVLLTAPGYLDQLPQALRAAVAEARIQAERRVAQDLELHMARLQALAAISAAFAEVSMDYASALATVAHQVAGLTGDLCAILLLSEDGAWLEPAAVAHTSPQIEALASGLLRLVHVPPGGAISEAVLAHGRAVTLNEIDPATLSDPLWSAFRLLHERDGLRAMAVLPLRAQGGVIGALVALRERPGQPYTPDDETFLLQIADRAAITIASARLHQSVRQELAARAEAEAAVVQLNRTLEARVQERTAQLEQANAELSRANAALARAAQLKDEFLASMSHELRTPLNAILGRAETLQEQLHGPLNERQMRSVRSIEESGRHLLELINDILDLSKIEAGKLELNRAPVAVGQLCQASLRLVAEAAARKGISVSARIEPGLTSVPADERRLKQILVNLLSNAVKFTPEGGAVGLDVTGDPLAGQLRFTVWDTGIGIAREDIGRLFRPFVQLDSSLSRQYNGTGLGLALVARMAELHGGCVSVESEPGHGSRFVVTLPWPGPLGAAPLRMVAERCASYGVPGGDAPPAGCMWPLVLLVEDNEENIAVMQEYIAQHGYRVATARDGYEAVAAAAELLPDVILMDIQLPGLDGLAAIARIRAHPALAAVPIVALTALAMPGDRERCLAAGASGYLSKPVALRELIQTIEHHRCQGQEA
ncbi:MAG TPA: response regulator [Roseiflexaceae bacterium]|nr:response regulator [Roseiflexaceae bacterium]